jgi:hypothetical protein
MTSYDYPYLGLYMKRKVWRRRTLDHKFWRLERTRGWPDGQFVRWEQVDYIVNIRKSWLSLEAWLKRAYNG